MKIVKAEGTWDEIVTVENLAKARRVFYVTTEKVEYRANDLDTVFKLWRSSDDESKVLHIGSSG
jgi:hypothetical protein